MIKRIAEKQPKILMMTNYVTMKLCADGLCALGAQPSMSAYAEEAEEIMAVSDALVLNLGTPSEEKHSAALLAAEYASEMDIPSILDVQGLFLSNIRLEMTRELLDAADFSVLKGNLQELKALAALLGCEDAESSREMVQLLAKETGSTVLCSGKEDIISDGQKIAVLKNGCAELGNISGTGCLLGAVCGAMLGSGFPPFEAALMAAALVDICGERALAKMKKNAAGIGSMAVFLLDELYLADESILEEIICEYKG
ncbi:MAG: hydroxyethylthiazole kinase [Firmicutes bacterium]|nr:hydroxyethylthiazole kinase [Bacillota bacterium]